MNRGRVESTFAKSVGYEHDYETGGILEIETHPSRTAPGHIYQYRGISPRMFATFIMSPSIGKYYNRKIKGQYEEVEVFEQHISEELATGVSMVDEDDFINKLAKATVDEIAERLCRPLKITY